MRCHSGVRIGQRQLGLDQSMDRSGKPGKVTLVRDGIRSANHIYTNCQPHLSPRSMENLRGVREKYDISTRQHFDIVQ